MKETLPQYDYYVLVADQQKGPYQLSQMQAMWRSGIITGKTHYWREGISEWAPCSSIASLLDPPAKPSTKTKSQPPAKTEPSQPPLFSTFSKVVITVIGGLILLLVSAAIIHNLRAYGSAYSPNSPVSSSIQKEVDQLSIQVAIDAERQYEIAKRSGHAVDAYTAASLVAAAYLQAKDEPNYQKWKRVEAQEAKRAGIPIP